MSSSTEAGDVEDASDDGVSVVVMTSAVDADKSWSMCDLDLEHFLGCITVTRHQGPRRRHEMLCSQGDASNQLLSRL